MMEKSTVSSDRICWRNAMSYINHPRLPLLASLMIKSWYASKLLILPGYFEHTTAAYRLKQWSQLRTSGNSLREWRAWKGGVTPLSIRLRRLSISRLSLRSSAMSTNAAFRIRLTIPAGTTVKASLRMKGASRRGIGHWDSLVCWLFLDGSLYALCIGALRSESTQVRILYLLCRWLLT